MKEIWKPVKSFEGEYEVSNLGNVRSIKFGKCNLLKSFYSRGYKKIELYLNGTSRKYYVHRLVATAFINNPNKREFVNHIDGHKDNNHYTNLEWVTKSENVIHAYSTGLIVNTARKSIAKPGTIVLQIDKKTGETIREFDSIRLAERELGIDRMGIKRTCEGRRKTAGGFIWNYKKHCANSAG